MDYNEVPKDKLQELISQVIQEVTSRDFKDDDERADFILDRYAFPVPDAIDKKAWVSFYEDETSPFRQYEDAVWNAIHTQENNMFDMNDNFDAEDIGNNNIGDDNIGFCNIGNNNIGDGNVGDYNMGNWNPGNRNVGSNNVGNYNIGHQNVGQCNAGSMNIGFGNVGNRNAGYRNHGSWNTGSWNSGDWNTGFFNTGTPTVRMFNRDTGLTIEEAQDIDFPDFLYFNCTTWVEAIDATEKEKHEHAKEISLLGGFMKMLPYKEAFRRAWDEADIYEHAKLFKLPNWNNEIFKEISGIDAEAEYAKELLGLVEEKD